MNKSSDNRTHLRLQGRKNSGQYKSQSSNNSGYNVKNYEQYSEDDDNDNVLSDSYDSVPVKKINIS